MPKQDLPKPAWGRSLSRKLLGWFDRYARDLPWRRTQDLYAIWVSEIMLQQTQVATVIPYWKRFIKQFPSARALARAREHDVLKLWEGLGYYRRARHMHAAARLIIAEHGGQFPTTFDAVRSLPGVGRYTAGAILSIGLGERHPILEANSIRVLSRLTAFPGDPASAAGQKHLWTVAEAILPLKQCGEFNQSLMELGSEVCTPKSPACERCPVAALCAAHRQRIVEQIPRLARRTKYEERTELAVIVQERGRVLLRHCQPGERWAGLWDYPRFVASGNDGGALDEGIVLRMRELVGFDVVPIRRLATLKHGVTRFRITLHCYEVQRKRRLRRVAAGGQVDGVRWVRLSELAEYPLSVTGRKISRLIERGCLS